MCKAGYTHAHCDVTQQGFDLHVYGVQVCATGRTFGWTGCSFVMTPSVRNCWLEHVAFIGSWLSFYFVAYPGCAWLIRRVLDLWSNLLDPYTTGYNGSQITIWHAVIFRMDTPLELFWLPTELNSTTPLYSFSSSDCPLIIPLHESHGKHRLLLSRMRVYWSVT
jgi:hypothetical protein